MCDKTKVISRVKNGEISMCKDCKNYNLVYNNFFFQFDKNQLNQFKDYIAKIDVDYWLGFSACTTQKRKIPIQTFHQNLFLVFDLQEINELKTLLGIKKGQLDKKLSPADIDYTLILN